MHVECAHELAVIVHDEQAEYLALLHDRRRFGRQGVRPGHHGMGGHQVAHLDVVNGGLSAFQGAAQVAVREGPDEPALLIHHGGHAQRLVGHFHERLRHGRPGRDARHPQVPVHDFLDREQQPFPEGPAGMGAGEVGGGKTPGLEQGDGQGVPQCQYGRGAGRGRQVERAGFARNRGVQVHVRQAGEAGLRVAGDGDEARAAPLEERGDDQELLAFARIRQGQQQVFCRDHAEVAVACFGRMHEECRGSGACKRGSDLVAHVPGFADAADHDPPRAGEHEVVGGDKRIVEPCGQLFDGFGLDGHHVTGQVENGCVVHGCFGASGIMTWNYT